MEGGGAELGEGVDEGAVAGPDRGALVGVGVGEEAREVVDDDPRVVEVEAAPAADGVGEGRQVGAQGAVLEDR